MHYGIAVLSLAGIADRHHRAYADLLPGLIVAVAVPFLPLEVDFPTKADRAFRPDRRREEQPLFHPRRRLQGKGHALARVLWGCQRVLVLGRPATLVAYVVGCMFGLKWRAISAAGGIGATPSLHRQCAPLLPGDGPLCHPDHELTWARAALNPHRHRRHLRLRAGDHAHRARLHLRYQEHGTISCGNRRKQRAPVAHHDLRAFAEMHEARSSSMPACGSATPRSPSRR